MLSIRSLFSRKNTTPDIQYIHLAETDSTNDYLRQLPKAAPGPSQPRMVVVDADYQTAGRGQGGNHWESEAGKNLLFSVLCHPNMVPIRDQFIISEAHALALYDALSTLAEGFSIKWPNDIYWRNKKVAGTLIETTLAGGHIRDCIIGTGIDVNQQQFVSDAPNPVSLRQILGHDVDRQQLLRDIVKRFNEYLQLIVNGDYSTIVGRYMSYLYRQHGFFAYRDKNGEFEAAIVEVEDDGHLILRDHDDHIRSYAFKEVEFVIPKD
jgi:BirA family biotin operon repressor/biotin-[acetyl-CoA-carboxylase] ligase